MTRNELIHTIFQYAPVKGCVKISNYQGKMCLIIKNSGSLDLTDKNISNWSHIKKLLDKTSPVECGICLTKDLMTSHIVCNECGNGICCGCFIIGIMSNKGICKCPFCRKTSGEECSAEALMELVIDRKIRYKNTIFDTRVDEFIAMKMREEKEANDSDDEEEEEDEEEDYDEYNEARDIDGYTTTEHIEYIDGNQYNVTNYGENVWYAGITATMGHLPYKFISKYAGEDDGCEHATLIVKYNVLDNGDVNVICIIDDIEFKNVMTKIQCMEFDAMLVELKNDTQSIEFDNDEEYADTVKYRHNKRKMLDELEHVIEISQDMQYSFNLGNRARVFNHLRVL